MIHWSQITCSNFTFISPFKPHFHDYLQNRPQTTEKPAAGSRAEGPGHGRRPHVRLSGTQWTILTRRGTSRVSMGQWVTDRRTRTDEQHPSPVDRSPEERGTSVDWTGGQTEQQAPKEPGPEGPLGREALGRGRGAQLPRPAPQARTLAGRPGWPKAREGEGSGEGLPPPYRTHELVRNEQVRVDCTHMWEHVEGGTTETCSHQTSTKWRLFVRNLGEAQWRTR